MLIAQRDVGGLPHAIFLHRAAGAASGRPGLDSQLGQAAFLALRLIDLLAPEQSHVHPDAFQYQWAATDRFCSGLRQAATEGAHLHDLVESSAAAHRHRDIALLTPALFAYAHYLEDALRLEEALDVLGAARQVTASRLSAADSVALWLRTGRVNRKLNQFDQAEQAYANAAQDAAPVGDKHSVLLSRIGRAECIRGRGNLQLAEAALYPILDDARRDKDRDTESRVEHVLGVVLHHMGQSTDAIPHVWRAFELYEDEHAQLRALNDLGLMMLTLGDANGAERALREVVRRDRAQDNVANATIELMHCASFRRDRVSFERYRAACEQLRAKMPANILADYQLKAGIGEARFGQFRRAAATMTRALKTANVAGLHSVVFKIERIKNGLHACEGLAESPAVDPEPLFETDALREVSASLAQLAGEPA